MPMQCKIYALVADLVLIREGAENRRAEGRKKNAYFCYALSISRNRKYTLVHTRNDLANAGFYTGFIPKIGDVVATFTNDDTSIFGTDESTEGKSFPRRGRGGLRAGFGDF